MLMAWALLSAAFSGQEEERDPHLRIDPAGETVTVDLSALKPFGAEELAVFWGDTAVEVKDGKAEIAQATPDKQLVVKVGKPSFELRIKFLAANVRRAVSGPLTLDKQEAAWLTTSGASEGEWKLRSYDPRYPAYAKDDLVTLDGVETSTLPPLLKAGKGAFHLVSPKSLTAWLTVAEKCYDSVFKNDWDGFVSCWSRVDRQQAKKHMDCKTAWNNIGKMAEKLSLKKYEFLHIHEGSLKGEETKTSAPHKADTHWSKKIMFRRVSDEGKSVGKDTSVLVTLEDGRWVVESITP